jgi:hypothetical protein
MDFAAACAEAAQITEFVEQYNRLTGNKFKLFIARTPIEAMVDKASGFKGFDEEEARKFAAFFYEFVWSRLPDGCFTDKPSRESDAKS